MFSKSGYEVKLATDFSSGGGIGILDDYGLLRFIRIKLMSRRYVGIHWNIIVDITQVKYAARS